MENKRYRPLFDKLYLWMLIPTNILIIAAVVLASVTEPVALTIMLTVFVFVNYFFLSPVFGYVELREEEIFIKFGFFMKRHIPYKSVRGIARARKFYADSMLSLKNSLDHINIKYNRFDMMSVSVKGNDELVEQISERAGIERN